MGFCSIRQQYSPELVRERAIGSLPALTALAGRGIQISWEVHLGCSLFACRAAVAPCVVQEGLLQRCRMLAVGQLGRLALLEAGGS